LVKIWIREKEEVFNYAKMCNLQEKIKRREFGQPFSAEIKKKI